MKDTSIQSTLSEEEVKIFDITPARILGYARFNQVDKMQKDIQKICK